LRHSTSIAGVRALFLAVCAITCSRAVLPKPIHALSVNRVPAQSTSDNRNESGEAAAASTGDFTLTVTPSTMTAELQEMDAEITVTAVDGFTGVVDLNCTVTPENVATAPGCDTPPYQLTLDSTQTIATGTLAIFTYPPTCNDLDSLFSPHFPTDPSAPIVAWVGLILLVCLTHSRSRWPVRRKWAETFALMTLFAAGLGMCGCTGAKPILNIQCPFGDGGGGTFPGQYTVTAIATSGSIMHTANVSFTVPQQ